MRMTCPKCQVVQDVDGKTATCPHCRTVLRRCVDCTHYDVSHSFCKAVNRTVEVGDSHYPTYSSASTYCQQYSPSRPSA